MTTLPKILLVNDDGIAAPGIRHLYHAIKEVANVTIVAPDAQQSGAGTSVTMRKPLHLSPYAWYEDIPAYTVSGTPADCVKMALLEVLQHPPDLILSGINEGSNAGCNVFYSGTVGGAVEAAFHGIPSIALSCANYHHPNFREAADTVPDLISYLLANPLPKGTLLNVNFPNPMKGVRLAIQGKSFWKGEPDKRQHPDGFHYYWLGTGYHTFDEHEESDIALLEQGYAAAVPVRVAELTHHDIFDQHRRSFSEHFSKNLSSL